MRVTFPATATDEEVSTFCETLERFYAQLTTHASWLLDCRKVKSVTARQRQLFAASEAKLRPASGRYNAGGGFVIDNALVRGALTAIMWLAPSAYPHEVFASVDAAERWCREQLAGAND